MSFLLNDRNLSGEIGRNARKSILEKALTWDSSAEKYIEIYKALKNKNISHLSGV